MDRIDIETEVGVVAEQSRKVSPYYDPKQDLLALGVIALGRISVTLESILDEMREESRRARETR